MDQRDEFLKAQSALLKRFEITAASRFVDIGAVRGPVHVLECGTGAPVVMVPGFGDPAVMWAPLMAKLTDFHLHAVDRPNFGLTGRAEHTIRSFRKLATDFLVQVLDRLGLERPLFVSNSIGSLWCTWLALEKPDRVSAMVHIGCPAFTLGTSAPLPVRLLSVRPLGRFLMRMSPPSLKQVHRFAKAIGGEDLTNLPELASVLVAAQKLPGVQDATLDLLHAVVRLRGARHEVALTAEHLSGLEHPTLLIWGDNDAFGGVDVGDEAARLLPNGELRIISGGGHVPWVGHPSEVAEAAIPYLMQYSSA
jgi:2-hydroxy-6-oxonona-2,4-dienedioate hydrolase